MILIEWLNNDLQVLKNSNMGEPVSRLLWSSSKETILACYHVGIYSDKELIGQGTFNWYFPEPSVFLWGQINRPKMDFYCKRGPQG